MIEHALSRAGTVGTDLLEVPGSSTPGARPALAPHPRERRPHHAHLSLRHVDGLGPRAHLLLQRRLPARHARHQVPVGARAAARGGVGGDLAGHRPAHRVGAGTGEATWDEALLLFLERNGYLEETYHTFSYSPLARRRRRGRPGCSASSARRPTGSIGERRLAHPAGPGHRPARWPRRAGRLRAPRRRLGGDPARPALHGDLPLRRGRRRARRRPRPGLAAGAPRRRADRVGRPTPRPGRPLRERGGGPRVRRRRPRRPLRRLPGRAVAAAAGAGRGAAAGPRRRRAGAIGFAGRRAQPVPPATTRRTSASSSSSRARSAPASPAPAPTRRSGRRAEALAELDRAKTRVLHQRQPRVPDAAHADARPDRGRPRRRRAIRSTRRGASSRSCTATRCGCCKLVNTLLDFSRLEAGRMRPRYEPLDLAALTADLASMFRLGGRARRPRPRGRLPTLASRRPRRPRDVGEDRSQPALERAQVHVRGRRSRSGCGATSDDVELTVTRHRHRHRRRPSSRGCSSASTASTGPARARTRAPASGSPSSPSWRGCTAGASASSSAPGQRQHVPVRVRARHRPPAARAGRPAGRAPLPARRRGRAEALSGVRCAEAMRWSQPTGRRDPGRAPARPPDAAARARRRRQRRHARLPACACWRRTSTVGVAGDGVAALTRVRERRPDLVSPT